MVGYLVGNDDWICHGPLEDNNGTWLNESLRTNCRFRFYRTHIGFVYIVFSILIIPANCFAIFKFYKSQMNKMFFLLTISLCLCNFAMSFNGFLVGFANISMDRQNSFSFFSCSFFFNFTMFINTCTMAIHAIISYERRKAITSLNFLTTNYRVYILLLLTLIYSALASFSFWITAGVFGYLEARIDRNSTQTIWICTSQDILFPGFAEAIWFTLVFGIPLSVIIYNYWYL